VVEATRFNRTKVIPSIYIGYTGVSPISSISIARISFSYLFSLIRIISAVYHSYIVGYTSSSFCSSFSFIAADAPALLVSGYLLLVVALSLCWALGFVFGFTFGGVVASRFVRRIARSTRMLFEAYTERPVNRAFRIIRAIIPGG
jgi:hypothetical protein